MSVDARPRRLVSRLGEHVNQPLLRNGYALVVNSGTTAVLGMVFWVLAARRFSVEDVGVGSALVAALSLLATIAQLNLSNVLARFLPTAAGRSTAMLAACSVVTAAAATVVGVAFLVGAGWWAPSLPLVGDGLDLDVWFVAALVTWCLFVLQDGALSGLRRSDWVLVKNVAYGILKVAALALPVVALSSYGVFLAWTVPVIPVVAAIALVMVMRLVPAHVSSPASPADPPELREVARYAFHDYVVALVGTGLTSALPLVVLEASGAAAAAYFTLAWSIFYSLYLVSRSMATSLLVEGAGDVGRLDDYSWRALVHTTGILAPLVAGTVLLAPRLMLMFGEEYAAEGSTLLRLLALSALPSAVIVLYSAMERVRRRMLRLVLVTVVINATSLVLIWAVLQTYGLSEVGLTWLTVQSVAAAVLLGTTMRTMWLPRLATGAGSGPVRVASGARAAAHRRGQRRVLQRSCPDLTAALGLDTSWHVQQVFPTTGDVVVAQLGDTGPEAVVKLALTERGADALLASCRAVDVLSTDPRLDGWAELLPLTLAVGRTADGHLAVAERHVAGRDGCDVIAASSDDTAVTTVLDQIGALHRRTGRPAVLDAEALQTCVDEPVARLEHWLGGASSCPATRRLQQRLREGLGQRQVTLGWTHGDLAPGNVIFTDDGRRAAGIVDWEHARADGVTDVDVAHFLLTVRMLREKRELGDLVCALVDQPWRGEGVLGDSSLVLLAWLHHVTGTVTRTGRCSPDGLWAACNVHPVLRQVGVDP